MRFLIHSRTLGVHFADRFDPELHIQPGHEMTIYDLRDNLYSTNGRTWTEITTIDLDLITLQPKEIKDTEIGVSMKVYTDFAPPESIDESAITMVDSDTRQFTSIQMTGEQFEILGHSLGIALDYRRPQTLPTDYYRNHFQAGEKHPAWNDLQKLLEMGFVKHRIVFDQNVFNVTTKGKQAFEIEFNRSFKKTAKRS